MAVDTDRIERNVVIAATLERVWELVTSPEHVGRWFADGGAEIDLRPGGVMTLTWQAHGTFYGRVEVVEPPHRFAYRWLWKMNLEAQPVPGNSTLAEFTLARDGDGTRVTVVESGFAGLDGTPDERTAALKSHTEGWGSELGELAAYAIEGAATP
jgi:uncharacterized protein YndB with AHSA1/START domain